MMLCVCTALALFLLGADMMLMAAEIIMEVPRCLLRLFIRSASCSPLMSRSDFSGSLGAGA